MVFGLCALPLAAGAGLAIDTMLAYSVEDQLQKSLDAAGLAAGRTALPENVEADARSYFNTNFGSAPALAEFDAEDLDIEVSEVGDELVLPATAVMPTRFMRLFGHDTVTVAATTRINREVRQMELALVLDNTGSMWGTPFTTMQAAAKDLVDIVYGDADTNPNLFVAVVPYVATVNMGAPPDWLPPRPRGVTPGATATPTRHRPGKAASWPGPAGSTRPTIRRATAPFRSYLYPDASDNDWGAPRNPRHRRAAQRAQTTPMARISAAGRPFCRWCRARPTVDAALDGMGAWSRGGTSGNEGLAWGWRVLSPRWRGLWGGDTPNTRPLDYDAADTDKVVVMLTDGNNEMLRTMRQLAAATRGLGLHLLRSAERRKLHGSWQPRTAQGVTDWNTRMTTCLHTDEK